MVKITDFLLLIGWQVRCVDSRTGAAVREFSGHKGAVLEMMVKDGVMVTASDDSTARVWDIS